MASDIGLVLRTEHHDLLVLADRCGRASRGFQDPTADLERRLRAHVVAAEEIGIAATAPSGSPLLRQAFEGLLAAVDSGSATGEVLAHEARRLVEAEQADLLPVLIEQVALPERRRMGRVFRIRRDAVLRATYSHPHRQRSQTELYELARRAGVEQRSTMTQAQLQAAVESWQRQRSHDAPAIG